MGAVTTLHIFPLSMAILELLYNKDRVVRTRRRSPKETILVDNCKKGMQRQMQIIDDDTIFIQEVHREALYPYIVQHERIEKEEINRRGGIVGHTWGNFRREYIWTPSEITPNK